MEEKSELSINKVFSSLTIEGKRLLISMCHPAEIGVTEEAMLAISEIEKEKLDPTIKELSDRGLFESGNLHEGKFVVGEGDRYRLPPRVKEQVLKDILKF